MGEDDNGQLEPRYSIITPGILGLHPLALHPLGRFYDKAIRHLMVKELELKPMAMRKEGRKWVYQTECGTVQITEGDFGSRTFVVFADKTVPRSEFRAGHLALDILHTLQARVWAPQYIDVYHITDKTPRLIIDLVAVNIDAQRGSGHSVILEDAIPLHYAKRKKVSASDDLIASLEREAVANLNAAAPGKIYPATVETTVANVWHESHGVLPGFMVEEQKAPRHLSTRLYRRASLTLESDAGSSGTGPQSGEARSL